MCRYFYIELSEETAKLNNSIKKGYSSWVRWISFFWYTISVWIKALKKSYFVRSSETYFCKRVWEPIWRKTSYLARWWKKTDWTSSYSNLLSFRTWLYWWNLSRRMTELKSIGGAWLVDRIWFCNQRRSQWYAICIIKKITIPDCCRVLLFWVLCRLSYEMLTFFRFICFWVVVWPVSEITRGFSGNSFEHSGKV